MSVLTEFDLQKFQPQLVEWGVEKPAHLADVPSEQLTEWKMNGRQKMAFGKAIRRTRGIAQKHTVRTVWKANFESLQGDCPAALELLQMVSVVEPERIPMEFAWRTMEVRGPGPTNQRELMAKLKELDARPPEEDATARCKSILFTLLQGVGLEEGGGVRKMEGG